MIDADLRARGIADPRVLAAMARAPRPLFVPPALRDRAWEDGPLPIGHGQTISQPFVVAYMTEALRVEPDHDVLEIGTGSGYQAAVLAALARRVDSVERVPALAAGARRALAEAGCTNVAVHEADGFLGWPPRAPYPRIMVTAAPPTVPGTLVDQLDEGGRLVLPVGVGVQDLVLVTREGGRVRETPLLPVAFVPLVPGGG